MEVIAAIGLSFIPALLYAWLLYWLDRYEKEPRLLLGGVFVWGAIVAAGFAYLLNTVFGIGIFILTNSEGATDIATGSLSAPLVEEGLKALAVLMVFIIFRKEFDSVLDGIIYAGITALGFAATENAFYLYDRGFLESGWEGLWTLFFLRVVFGAWNHPFYTSFTGIGLAAARLNRSNWIKYLAPICGLVLSVFAHFLHNTLAIFVESIETLAVLMVIDWFSWLLMLAILFIAMWQEKRWIIQQLLEEVENGVLSPAQYRVASSRSLRTFAQLTGLGLGRFRDTKRFYDLCTELAYKKHQFSRLGEHTSNPQELIEALRSEVKQLSSKAAA